MLTRHQIEELLSESDSEAEERKLDHESSLEDFEILSDEGSVTYIGISEGESICSDAQPFSVPPQEEDPSSGFLSKDKKTIWYDKCFSSLVGRKRDENVITTTPGPTQYAIARVIDIKSTFELFMTKDMQTIIITMTNIEGNFHRIFENFAHYKLIYTLLHRYQSVWRSLEGN